MSVSVSQGSVKACFCAGMVVMLMVIPIQLKLMTRIKELSKKIAVQTEKRDRLAGTNF